jgi:hypothetical protein
VIQGVETKNQFFGCVLRSLLKPSVHRLHHDAITVTTGIISGHITVQDWQDNKTKCVSFDASNKNVPRHFSIFREGFLFLQLPRAHAGCMRATEDVIN